MERQQDARWFKAPASWLLAGALLGGAVGAGGSITWNWGLPAPRWLFGNWEEERNSNSDPQPASSGEARARLVELRSIIDRCAEQPATSELENRYGELLSRWTTDANSVMLPELDELVTDVLHDC